MCAQTGPHRERVQTVSCRGAAAQASAGAAQCAEELCGLWLPLLFAANVALHVCAGPWAGWSGVQNLRGRCRGVLYIELLVCVCVCVCMCVSIVACSHCGTV